MADSVKDRQPGELGLGCAMLFMVVMAVAVIVAVLGMARYAGFGS